MITNRIPRKCEVRVNWGKVGAGIIWWGSQFLKGCLKHLRWRREFFFVNSSFNWIWRRWGKVQNVRTLHYQKFLDILTNSPSSCSILNIQYFYILYKTLNDIFWYSWSLLKLEWHTTPKRPISFAVYLVRIVCHCVQLR